MFNICLGFPVFLDDSGEQILHQLSIPYRPSVENQNIKMLEIWLFCTFLK